MVSAWLRDNRAVRILGINCTPHEAYFAVSEDGSILGRMPERLRPPAGLEVGERLVEFIGDVRNVLGQIQPDRVAMLLPEIRERGDTHQKHMPRIVLETLVRVAAAQEGIDLDLVQRPTLRAKLGLPAARSLDTHLGSSGVVPEGHYWNDGRGLAALVAVAGTR